MPDPVLDPSAPCCRDLSRVRIKLGGCSVTANLSPGATGGLPKPATGTWANSLNATGGGAGGGSGSSWSSSDATPSESWS